MVKAKPDKIYESLVFWIQKAAFNFIYNEAIGMRLDRSDVVVSTYRKLNKNYNFRTLHNGIRIKHKETGIVVRCHSDPRSQHKNYTIAMEELREILAQRTEVEPL